LAAAVVLVTTGAVDRADAGGNHKRRPRPAPAPAPAPDPEPDAGPPEPPPSNPNDTYAVAAIDIAGDADPELKTAIATSVGRGLDRASAPHVAPEVVQQALRARPELVGCTSTTCLATLGGIVGASRFITVRIETAGSSFKIDLTVLTGDGPAAHKQATCEVCTMSDLGDLLAKKSAELITQPSAQPLSVTFTTTPAGAEIAVAPVGDPAARRSLGRTPATTSLAPGEYVIEATLVDHAPERRTITIADSGQPQSIPLALREIEETPATTYHLWKWVAVGAAATAIVIGGDALTYDGKGTCSTEPCPQNYEATASGIGFIGLGVLVGAAAGWMFWQDHQEASHAHAAILPTRGGVAASLSVDF
jgi:hypothetical protein